MHTIDRNPNRGTALGLVPQLSSRVLVTRPRRSCTAEIPRSRYSMSHTSQRLFDKEHWNFWESRMQRVVANPHPPYGRESQVMRCTCREVPPLMLGVSVPLFFWVGASVCRFWSGTGVNRTLGTTGHNGRLRPSRLSHVPGSSGDPGYAGGQSQPGSDCLGVKGTLARGARASPYGDWAISLHDQSHRVLV